MSLRSTEEMRAFDVCGPLPTGVTVLEASAGTGKTFTISALAARFVAEGMTLGHLLLVTFTRMATGELRDRVRAQLVAAERGLGLSLAGFAPGDDGVVALLSGGPQETVELRRRRLADALADFDAATIATTHEFCHHVLSGLGVAADVERDVTFVENPRDLVEEVVADFYVRKFHVAGRPPFDLAEARRIAHAAVENHDALLEPAGAPEGSVAAMRRRLAQSVRHEVELRRRKASVLTYDDLLTRLRSTLADPVRGAVACRRLRERYRVALVDEFQDTDPVQWEILQRAFGDGGSTLVLIGDPKQAIYGFRGADVYAYLEAARSAGDRATLGVNWRSDQALLDGYDALFGGAKLGHEGIVYRHVKAAALNRERRLVGAPGAALRARIVVGGEAGLTMTPTGFLNTKAAREHVAGDLAADVVRLLQSGAVLTEDTGPTRAPVPVCPGHIAVLVHRHRDAAAVREALQDVGVPAVINGAGSVFATPMATEWLRFLEALERPTSTNGAHAAALTPFLGWSADRVATAEDGEWEQVHARLHRWAAVLRHRGVASLLETVSHAEQLPARMLAISDGERRLTDLRHIGQLLHAAATADQLGTTALTGWLRQRITNAAQDGDAEDRTRRLDSDADAVQVLTIHRSKGLEFPVVYCPYLWDLGWVHESEPPVYHDAGNADRRTVDVGGPGPGAYLSHRWQYTAEQRGEDLRLAYVALTRAKHQAVVWWAGTYASRDSALCRLLFGRAEDGTVVVAGDHTPDDEAVLARLSAMAEEAPGCISVERTGGAGAGVWREERGPAQELRAGRFERTLDPLWRRTSYSGITAGAHQSAAQVDSEPEEGVLPDELPPMPTRGSEPDEDEPGLRSVPSLLAGMPGGVGPGTFVHSVLEHIDFASADLQTDLLRGVTRQQARSHTDVGDPEVLAMALRAAIETPLGEMVGQRSLRDITRGNRIDELGFELPLVGGDAPTGELSMSQVAALLRQHLGPDDVFHDYAPYLEDPSVEGGLRGYLSGSLDLVFRISGSAGVPRFAVADYKTNRLAGAEEELSAWHYRPSALRHAMYRSHYPLQALLYIVALHRYLRWRLPGYSAKANLAGVLYLFLRGMSGPSTPVVAGHRCGVFAWVPPPALVEALSDLLHAGRPPS